MNRLHTRTQLKKSCRVLTQQEKEFNNWFGEQQLSSVLNISEYAEWDTVGQQQRLWDQFSKGSAPWDLIMYFNNTQIVELGDLCRRIDNLVDQLSPNGQIYMAMNKWCIRVATPDSTLINHDFDSALPLYVQRKLTNFKINKYCYIPDERGGIGNWVHGNNRFWLAKHEQN